MMCSAPEWRWETFFSTFDHNRGSCPEAPCLEFYADRYAECSQGLNWYVSGTAFGRNHQIPNSIAISPLSAEGSGCSTSFLATTFEFTLRFK